MAEFRDQLDPNDVLQDQRPVTAKESHHHSFDMYTEPFVLDGSTPHMRHRLNNRPTPNVQVVRNTLQNQGPTPNMIVVRNRLCVTTPPEHAHSRAGNILPNVSVHPDRGQPAGNKPTAVMQTLR